MPTSSSASPTPTPRDDWKNIEEVIRSNRGQLAEIKGPDAAQSDYLILALGNAQAVAENYNQARLTRGPADRRGLRRRHQPVVRGKTRHQLPAHRACVRPGRHRRLRQPPALLLWTRWRDQLAAQLEGAVPAFHQSPRRPISATDDVELGSNAIAVAPRAPRDRHTCLAVNSHQPYEGNVAWYEARLKSEEGIDIIGGVFPGTPLILHGAGPSLGWAATVNKPDVYDIFLLTVDDQKNPTRYRMNEEWKDLTRRPIRYNVLENGVLKPGRAHGLLVRARPCLRHRTVASSPSPTPAPTTSSISTSTSR